MLRRGYDMHLRYANFGIRKLLIRLPQGLPDAQAFKPYAVKGSLEFLKDKSGPGGCLSIEPYFEAGSLDELWEIGTLLDKLVPSRAELLSGDLRPLYLAHLAVLCDTEQDPDEVVEVPVPAGLEKLSQAQCALTEFYGLSGALIAAAALDSPPLPAKVGGSAENYERWLRDQPDQTKNEWLASLMNDPTAAVRAAILANIGANLPCQHGRQPRPAGPSRNFKQRGRRSPRTARRPRPRTRHASENENESVWL